MKKTTILENNPKEFYLSPKEGWAELKCFPFEIYINPTKQQIVEKIGRYVDLLSYNNKEDFRKDILRFFRISGGSQIYCRDIPKVFSEFCKLNLDHICK